MVEVDNMIRKTIDESWDFRLANTKEFTHCFHSYPAMMIPQVARRIIENFGKNAQLLFDPYCGTGTSLVEANLKGINAIGTDINPLARLIATSKTTKLDIKDLDHFINHFSNVITIKQFQPDFEKTYVFPAITNIDFWFSKSTQKKLAFVLEYINTEISNQNIKDFFKVAFSETVREVSYLKQGEFKLVRTKKLEVKNDSDVFKIMLSKLHRNKIGLLEFQNACLKETYAHIYDFNTVELIPEEILKPNSVDIVVTSPPYGDSHTTVAYGQYSRFSNEWLGFKDAKNVDKKSMGGIKHQEAHRFKCDILNDVIETIRSKDKKRAEEVLAFYKDYERSISNVSKVIKKGGFACYVVGNRTVKGVNIPTDEITYKLFQGNGFTHVETIIRNIPNKRMPLKNSPTNIPGKTASTMKNEYIVICKKD